jgi:hypothetical protein
LEDSKQMIHISRNANTTSFTTSDEEEEEEEEAD